MSSPIPLEVELEDEMMLHDSREGPFHSDSTPVFSLRDAQAPGLGPERYRYWLDQDDDGDEVVVEA
jgi:hypothetical protein